MKKLILLAAAVLALIAPGSAAAHPLGNFTVNRYSGIELSGDRIYVVYVLDMAEIPAFQERQKMGDPDAFATRTAAAIGRRLQLSVDGRPLSLRPLRHVLTFPPGAAGLTTMRLQVAFATPRLEPRDEPLRLSYRDGNYRGRIGWFEVTVRGKDGARVVSSSVPSSSSSDELKAYPKDLLKSPLEVDSATASFEPGTGAGTPPELPSGSELTARVGVQTPDGGFAGLIAKKEVTPSVLAIALLVALFWGAAHAFSPGHGKAIVAGYLVGTRGTPRHAVLLGLIVTVTHTIGVFALGLVTLALSEFIVPEQLYPWLNLVSALLVVGVGLAILRWRLRDWQRGREHSHTHHHHGHDHEHEHGELRGLLGIGISAGILPCPTALVVLLAAISLQRIGYGLVLIVAFSVGLAAAVTSIGLLAVTAKRAFSRMSFDGTVIRLLPAVSAVVVLGVGVAMTLRALSPLV